MVRNLRVNPSVKVKIANHVFTGKANLYVEKSQVGNVIKMFKDKYGERVYNNTYSSDVDCTVALKSENPFT